MTALPTPSDPEIAAATFRSHLDAFFADQRHAQDGWGRVIVTPLMAVAVLAATRADGTTDPYFLRLEADWYDEWPPRLAFVEPARGWPEAEPGSRSYPVIAGSPLPAGAAPGQTSISFALHTNYQMAYGETRQLLCFSHSFDYYFSGHVASEDQQWLRGTHTASASLRRVWEVLQSPNYLGPSDAPYS